MDSRKIIYFLNILYIEDDKSVRDNINTTLGYLCKNIYSVSSAKEALDIFNTQKIDIIITDINMPEINGIDFIKEIRDIDDFIPIIITTAYETKEYLIEAMPLYIEKYLVKPITLDRLIEALEKSVKKLKKLKLLDVEFKNETTYNLISKIFLLKNKEIEKLSNKEQLLFELLLEHKNEVCTYEMIQSYVWDENEISMGNLKIMINKIRTLIGKESILNRQQIGYELIL